MTMTISSIEGKKNSTYKLPCELYETKKSLPLCAKSLNPCYLVANFCHRTIRDKINKTQTVKRKKGEIYMEERHHEATLNDKGTSIKTHMKNCNGPVSSYSSKKQRRKNQKKMTYVQYRTEISLEQDCIVYLPESWIIRG